MNQLSKTNWLKINDFLLSISSEHTIDELNSKVLTEISQLIPFGNSGNFMELDGNFRATIKNSIQTEKKWSDSFNRYFFKIATQPSFDENIFSATYDDLRSFNRDEYINDFIFPQKINSTAGFVVFDHENIPSSIFVFNRSSSESIYNEKELTMLKIIQPHICNYYRTLYLIRNLIRMPVMSLELEKQTRLLSERESEIVYLLLQRYRPVDIAKDLKISILTVRRHIHNIYNKLHVMDRQQLFEKISSNNKSK
jgi:DNA-binding CsgD family transcriptional regulator